MPLEPFVEFPNVLPRDDRQWILGARSVPEVLVAMLGRLAVPVAAALLLCGCADQARPNVSGASTSVSPTAPAPTLRPDPSLAVPVPPGQWAVVTDPESRASMLMPRPIDPRRTDDKGVVGIGYAGNGVTMAVTRLPVGTRGDLQGTVDRTVQSLGGRVLTSEALTVDGHPGREVLVEGPESRGFVFVRVVVTSLHIVSATAGGRTRGEAEGNRARAFPTFHVP